MQPVYYPSTTLVLSHNNQPTTSNPEEAKKLDDHLQNQFSSDWQTKFFSKLKMSSIIPDITPLDRKENDFACQIFLKPDAQNSQFVSVDQHDNLQNILAVD